MIALLKNWFGPPNQERDAFARYRLFHRKDHKATGAFHADLVIPTTAYLCGPAIHIMYRSDKIDPDTGEDPKRPINYIHEHDSVGVKTYTPGRPYRRPAHAVNVPDFLIEAEWLVLLGKCLGIAYKTGRHIVELESRGKLTDELYTTPDGQALLVIRDKRAIQYLTWGGGLDVRPEGIVG